MYGGQGGAASYQPISLPATYTEFCVAGAAKCLRFASSAVGSAVSRPSSRGSDPSGVYQPQNLKVWLVLMKTTIAMRVTVPIHPPIKPQRALMERGSEIMISV